MGHKTYELRHFFSRYEKFWLKGQLISEWNFGLQNFPKMQQKIVRISAKKSKKWSNQTNKDILTSTIASTFRASAYYNIKVPFFFDLTTF